MNLGRKIFLSCLGILLLAVGIYVAFYFIRYVNFDKYKDSLSTYTAAESSDYKPVKEKAKDKYDLVAENDNLQLYLDPTEGYIAVYDKVNDIWNYSTPEDIDKDTVANVYNKALLKSQLKIYYYNSARTKGNYNTFTDAISVDASQFTIASIENGVRLTYNFKPKQESKSLVPYTISKERFEAFIAKLDPTENKKDIKELNKNYKLNDEGDTYVILKALSDGTGAAKSYDSIYKILYNKAGYTSEDYMIDMADSGVEIKEQPSFKVSLDVSIDNNSLIAEVPASLIEESNGSIYQIEVLPGFAYASSSENGYFVVPNGSGSLINFNSAKKTQYTSFIYGIDPEAANYIKVENAQVARLPLYAVCKDNSSVLAVIEDGASLAQISTQIAGAASALSSYNTADFSFTIRGGETLDMFGTSGNASTIPLVEKDFADVNMRVRYTFLGKENADYSGVANYIRETLVKDGTITANGDIKSKNTEDIAFYYDVIGAVKTTEFFVGVRYLGVTPMTTYAQAKDIAKELSDAGINNQVVNYQGWFNGGYYHDVTDKVKNIGKLGSLSAFEDLAAYVEGLGGKVYAETAFQLVTDISKRYRTSYEAARYYAGYAVELGQVNPTTLRQTASLGYRETLYSVVSPKFLIRYVDSFISKTEDLDVTGISLRDLGDVLSSDKKRTEMINREEALDIVIDQLEKFGDNGDKQVMISGGNLYAVGVADDIINAPIGHNEYYGVDEEIPFYEMIFHGYVDYAGYDINTSDTYDVDQISLRLIEFGASPRFVFTHDEANEMKYTGVNSVYSSTFSTWKDTAVEIYEKVNSALKYVKNAEIVKHEIIENGVSKITYSNGVIIIVNSTSEAATVDGTEVKAMSYVMEGVN